MGRVTLRVMKAGRWRLQLLLEEGERTRTSVDSSVSHIEVAKNFDLRAQVQKIGRNFAGARTVGELMAASALGDSAVGHTRSEEQVRRAVVVVLRHIPEGQMEGVAERPTAARVAEVVVVVVAAEAQVHYDRSIPHVVVAAAGAVVGARRPDLARTAEPVRAQGFPSPGRMHMTRYARTVGDAAQARAGWYLAAKKDISRCSEGGQVTGAHSAFHIRKKIR